MDRAYRSINTSIATIYNDNRWRGDVIVNPPGQVTIEIYNGIGGTPHIHTSIMDIWHTKPLGRRQYNPAVLTYSNLGLRLSEKGYMTNSPGLRGEPGTRINGSLYGEWGNGNGVSGQHFWSSGNAGSVNFENETAWLTPGDQVHEIICANK